MSLVVKKNIREFFKNKGVKVSESAFKALDKEIEKICLKSADNVLADKLKVIKENHVPKLDALLSASNSLDEI